MGKRKALPCNKVPTNKCTRKDGIKKNCVEIITVITYSAQNHQQMLKNLKIWGRPGCTHSLKVPPHNIQNTKPVTSERRNLGQTTRIQCCKVTLEHETNHGPPTCQKNKRTLTSRVRKMLLLRLALLSAKPSASRLGTIFVFTAS